MSDRMTNTEIEDVLTSIRRLVSEEARFPFRSERARGADEPAEKLVLTPDFRVAREEEAEPPTEAANAFAKAAAPAENVEVVAPVEPVGAEAAEAEPEIGELPAEPALRERVAVLEAAVSDESEDYEPDGSEVTPSAYLSEPLPEPDEEPQAGVAESEVTEAAELEVAEAFEAVAEPATDWTEEESQPMPHFAHRVEAEADARIFEETAPDELDEEALRDMIREIIREELQGALGERITRNLRKLVRSEINRALAGREFGG